MGVQGQFENGRRHALLVGVQHGESSGLFFCPWAKTEPAERFAWFAGWAAGWRERRKAAR